MGQLTTRRTYLDAQTPVQSDLDLFLNDIETFLNITKLNNDNIQDSSITASTKISPLSINTAKFKNLAVTTAKILDANVTTAKIADSAITTAKITDANVTTIKIPDSAVTTAKINDLAVTTAKIVDASVTNEKLVLNTQISSSSGYQDITGTADITNCSVSITTTGYPVLIAAIPGDATNDSYFLFNGANPNLPNSYVNISRDATVIFREPCIATDSVSTSSGISLPPSIVFYIDDTPGAGTYTYKLSCNQITGGCYVNHIRLFVMELVR